MRFGLTDQDLADIISVLKNTQSIHKAVIFGSRALGTYHSGSDIDIAVFGDITHDAMLNLKISLDELELLYKIDLVHFESITNPDFVDHINRVGIDLFTQ